MGYGRNDLKVWYYRRMIKKDITDSEGFKIRVALPDDSPDDLVEYGIEIGLDLRDIYPDGPVELLKALQDRLYERGFIEPSDFRKPNALKDIRSAILAVVGYDAHTILQYGRQLNGE